jgi:AraC-like DNA-binding protein
MPSVRPRNRITAWRPAVAGIAEVFHAHLVDYAYPAHTHETWALMVIEDGLVDFALDRHRHGVDAAGLVALLPPGVAHDGRTVTTGGFRKRVLYLDTGVLPERYAGAAVDTPILTDSALRDRIRALHHALAHPGDAFEAESRLAFVRERLRSRLAARPPAGPPPAGAGRAAALRELLDARLAAGLTLREASALLDAHPTALLRAFKRAYGLPPHAYLTGRRISRARELLLTGRPPADVATAVGFYDQAHLTRHFRRHLGVPPGHYAGTAAMPGEDHR